MIFYFLLTETKCDSLYFKNITTVNDQLLLLTICTMIIAFLVPIVYQFLGSSTRNMKNIDINPNFFGIFRSLMDSLFLYSIICFVEGIYIILLLSQLINQVGNSDSIFQPINILWVLCFTLGSLFRISTTIGAMRRSSGVRHVLTIFVSIIIILLSIILFMFSNQLTFMRGNSLWNILLIAILGGALATRISMDVVRWNRIDLPGFMRFLFRWSWSIYGLLYFIFAPALSVTKSNPTIIIKIIAIMLSGFAIYLFLMLIIGNYYSPFEQRRTDC
ncbi:MAG TPA: hypothetical protein VGB37_13570 [Candidatus Lokiarchaeia archaeon]